MKAADCLREPGDAARRESDGAVAVWSFDDDSLQIYVHRSCGGCEHKAMPSHLEGDDWQPLHPAGDHAAEVKRLTAERDEAGEAIKQLTAETGRLKWERDTLTARVAELESGIRDAMLVLAEGDGGRGVCHYSAEGEMRVLTLGGLIRQLSRIVGDDTHPGDDEASAFSPLPTAGDEADQGWLTPGRKILYAPSSDRYFVGRVRAKPHTLCDGTPVVHLHEMEPAYAEYTGKKGDKAHSVYAAAVCNCQPYREARPAPAEPDSPAEERPSKLRDESWIREAADAEDQHASVCAGDMAPRKPDCLDGVPAVLCEDDNGDSVWAFGPVDVCGEMAAVWMQGEYATLFLTDAASLKPIHHDAAAVELAGRIERGGSNG